MTMLMVSLIPSASLHAQTPGGVSSPVAWSETSNIDSMKIQGGSGFTFVGISKTSNDCEYTLWSLSDGKSAELLQTTSRTADLGSGSFMNCTPDSGKTTQLYSYSVSKNIGGRTLYLGKSRSRTLPSQAQSGALVEYAVYDRSISALERAQVESFMALRHGITLKSSYYDSRGRVIWNKYRNQKYQNRISGIASDSASAQHILSASSREDGAFAHITSESLANGQSLLFGDDGGKLSFTRSTTYGKWMGRKWKTQSTDMPDTHITLTASTSDIRQIQPLEEGESYYLAIDTTGNGTFKSNAVRYVKATAATGDSIAFTDIKAGGDWTFTFRAEKDLFTTIDVEQPGEQQTTGTLHLAVTGGISPYSMRLERESTPAGTKSGDSPTAVFENLQEGTYKLTTSDRIGNVAVNEFRINKDGQTEILPGINGGDTDGCLVRVWPNPTTDGKVSVQIEQTEALPVTMTLRTLNGATQGMQSLPADTYYYKQVYLPQVGTYLLSVTSGENTKTVKVIRK